VTLTPSQFQEAARKLVLEMLPADRRDALCALGHCACSETPPAIPLVRAKIVKAVPEEIMPGTCRLDVELEVFGKNTEGVLDFLEWLASYLPVYDSIAAQEAAEAAGDGTETPPAATRRTIG
jgi:hypothetical protein